MLAKSILASLAVLILATTAIPQIPLFERAVLSCYEGERRPVYYGNNYNICIDFCDIDGDWLVDMSISDHNLILRNTGGPQPFSRCQWGRQSGFAAGKLSLGCELPCFHCETLS